MTEREYDASVDLHDSYYAAVAELRQRHLNGLPIVPPEQTKTEQAKADAIIALAIKLKKWPLVEDAVDLKLEEQGDFVRWWAENVRSAGKPLIVADRATISAAEATQFGGYTKDQVARWNKKLKDYDKYRAQQILAAFKRLGIEPPENFRALGTGNNEWFTPPQYIEAAREVMVEIDLDPATHPVAQQTVRAISHYTAADNGLVQPWHGRVWLNPPYAAPLVGQFIAKLVEEVTARNVAQAIVLTHNYTDGAWFHHAESAADLLCFTRGRVKFVDPDGDECMPTQGQAFFYYGPHGDRFRNVFGQFGFVR
jgi:ParB family chromosome partitioning protein